VIQLIPHVADGTALFVPVWWPLRSPFRTKVTLLVRFIMLVHRVLRWMLWVATSGLCCAGVEWTKCE